MIAARWPALLFLAARLFAQTDAAPGGSQPEQPPPEPAPVPIGKGVISGTVVNAKGKLPLKKASVSVHGPVSLTAVTDSRGAFTFRALPPGGYVITASHEDFFATGPMSQFQRVTLADGEEKGAVEVSLTPGAIVSGRILDEDDSPLAGCSVSGTSVSGGNARRRQFSGSGSPTDVQGTYRIHGLQPGRYSLRAQCQITFPAPHGFMKRGDPMIPHEGYAPTVYGQGDSAISAGGLAISAGAELTGVDFHLKRVPLYVVRGTLSGGDSSALSGAQLQLTPVGSSGGIDEGFNARYDAAKGVFSFQRVPAGSYELTATVFNPEHVFEARQTVEVGKTQVTQADLRLLAAASIAGSIEFDDPSQRMDNLQLSLQSLSGNYRGPFPAASVQPDNTFLFKGVVEGHYRLQMPLGYVKTLSLAGREVTPTDFEIGAQSSGLMRIVVGTKTSKVDVDLSPKPDSTQGLTGFLLPADHTEMDGWRNNISSGVGQIQFNGVAPGKYRVLVVASPDAWALANSPEALHALESHLAPLEVKEGEDTKVSVPLVGADDMAKAMEADE